MRERDGMRTCIGFLESGRISVAREVTRRAPCQQVEKKEYVPISGVMLVSLGKKRIVKVYERVWRRG